MTHLFQSGEFLLNSGIQSPLKIECDALQLLDWNTLARCVSAKMIFTHVLGVPTGGIRFALALKEFTSSISDEPHLLIVDDVLTTGGSMERMREQVAPNYEGFRITGVVAFARQEPPEWVRPIFQMWT